MGGWAAPAIRMGAGLLLLCTDPGPGVTQDRVAQETLEALQLEKRLSLLSHAGRPGSAGGCRHGRLSLALLCRPPSLPLSLLRAGGRDTVPRSQEMIAACPARPQRPATQMLVQAAGWPHGQSPPPLAHHKRALGRRPLAFPGHPPSRCGCDHCRMWAARVPRTAALLQAAIRPAPAASRHVQAAAWMCGMGQKSKAPCSAFHRVLGCAPARRLPLSTRCPVGCEPTMTRHAACARPSGTRAQLSRGALKEMRYPGTPAVPLAGWVQDVWDRPQKHRHQEVRPWVSLGKWGATRLGPPQDSFPSVMCVEASR